MGHGNYQSKFIGHLLQCIFPGPEAIAVGAAAIGLNQKMLLLGKLLFFGAKPPTTNTGYGEFWRWVREAYHPKPFVGCCILNSIRNRYTVSVTGIIAFQNVQLFPTIRASWIFKVPDQFARLDVHRDRRKTRFFVLFSRSHPISHLAIPIRVFPFIQSFSVGPENVSAFLQQTPNRIVTHFLSWTLEGSANRVRGFLGPF